MFLNRILFAVFISSVVILFSSCKDEPAAVGLDDLLHEKPTLTSFDSQTDSINQYSYSFKRVLPLAASSRLLLGKADNVDASILMKFLIIVQDSIQNELKANNINVISAKVSLVKNYAYGDTNSTLNFNAYEITSKWGIKFTSDSTVTYDEGNNLIVPQSSDLGDSIYSFNIDNSKVLDWLKATSDTSLKESNGIILKPADDSKKVVGFTALNLDLSSIPTLQIVLEKPGAYLDTLTFIPSSDVGVVNGNLPAVNPDEFFVQGGLTAASKVYFDVSRIPVDALLSTAELIFTIDTLQSKVGSPYNNSILAYALADSTNLDSVYSTALLLSRNENTFSISSAILTAYVQNWIHTGNNQGLLITINGQTNGVESFVLKGSAAANLSERPKLKLTYTRLK